MSFVSRRLQGDESNLLTDSSNPGELDGSDHSGVRLAIRGVGLLMVGVDEETAAIATAAAMELGVSFARSPHGPAACRTMEELIPSVVIVSSRLWRDEREAIAAIASDVGATILYDNAADRSKLALRIAEALASDGAARLAG